MTELKSLLRTTYGLTGSQPKVSALRLAYAATATCALLAAGVSAQTPTAADDPPAPLPSHTISVVGPASRPSNDILAQVIANQKKMEQAQEVYERTQRVESRRAGSELTSTEVRMWRLFPFGTGIDRIPLTPEAKPLNPETYHSDLEKLERLLVWAAQSGSAQREAYAKMERKRKERNDLIEATRTAFIYTPVGTEIRGDRKLLKYSIKPNPDYKPTTRNAIVFTRVEGTVWIDEKSNELAKIEGHVTEDISLALFLAKVYKGSYFMQERYELFPGTWLPTFEQYDFDGRKFLVPFSLHERTFYENYKRVGPPKEAVEVVRGELNKSTTDGPSR